MTGLMMAMVTVATMIIQIPIPFTNGYIHLGDSMIFLSVLVLGWRYGAIAAAFGSALGDLIPGYVHWVPWTFCIKGMMAVLMGLAIEKCINKKRNTAILAGVTAAVWAGFQGVLRVALNTAAANNPKSLLGGQAASLSELGGVLSSVQNKLLLSAVLIPIFLIAIALYVRKKERFTIPLYDILGMTIAGLWMVLGYYIAGGVMYGNFPAAAFSVPWNIVQFVMGFFLAAVISLALQKTAAGRYFTYQLGSRVSVEK